MSKVRLGLLWKLLTEGDSLAHRHPTDTRPAIDASPKITDWGQNQVVAIKLYYPLNIVCMCPRKQIMADGRKLMGVSHHTLTNYFSIQANVHDCQVVGRPNEFVIGRA